MNHLDEGTLQAFLDDELKTPERADAAEHMMGCGACRTLHDDLRRANALVSRAVAELDVDPPAREAHGAPVSRRMARTGTGAFVKAAGLLLFLAAAASAAVPGSPVREWIVSALDSSDDATAAAPAPVPAPVALEPPPAGVSLMPRAGELDVEVSDLDGTVIRLQEGAGESVTVSARGGQRDPTFRSAAGRIGVHGGTGGELIVELSPSLARGRLTVDGRVYAQVVDGALQVLVPGETVDGGVVWR